MIKRILFISLLLLVCFLVKAQENAQPLGAPTTAVKVRGRLYVDSVFYAPRKDTLNNHPLRAGAITILPSDDRPYFWDGARWLPMYYPASPCVDSLRTVEFVVTGPENGSSVYVNPELVGMEVKVYREGERQGELGQTSIIFSQTTGTINFSPVLNYGERVKIDYNCDPSFTISAANSIISQAGQVLLTESGLILIIN